MKTFKYLTIIYIILLSITAGIALILFNSHNKEEKNNSQVIQKSPEILPQSLTATSKFIRKEKVEIPIQLTIPTINLAAEIVPVGVNPDTTMQVPDNSVQVGWLNVRAKPGEIGNAVLDGHLMAGKEGGVFHNLNKINLGESIFVKDKNGIEREFRVTHTKLLDYNETELNDIFGPSEEKNLIIITCQGDWLPEAQTFTKRLIVYSTLIN